METWAPTKIARMSMLCVVAGIALLGCERAVVDPTPGEGGPALAAALAFSAWSEAVDIELSADGAHPEFNTPFADGCPFISRDGKRFFIASNRTGTLGGLDIWMSTRPRVGEPWGEPVNVGAPINSPVDDFCPTLASDGQTFYFVSRRQDGVQGQDWCGGSDIYVSRLRSDGGFEGLQHLGCELNSAADEFSPFPIREGGGRPVLYYSSTRPGLGAGGDLYVSESHGGVFGPGALVPGVNSEFDDGQPNVRLDGLEIFFYSIRPGADAQGGNDIYAATRASVSDPWSTPVNLGPNINSAASETRPSVSFDGTTLYFGSTRAGSNDVYVTTRAKIRGGG